MLYYKSARNRQPKWCVPAKSHKSQWCEATQARPILFQLKSSLPFSFFLFLWRLESTTTKSFFRHLNCRLSLLLKAVDSNFVRNGGNIMRTHSSLCSWAGVAEKITNIIFRKYNQDSAFRVSGVLQLSKAGPPATKTSQSFACSSQLPWWIEGFTHLVTSTVLICVFWRRGMSHIFDSNWPTSKQEKKIARACPKPKLKNYESEDHRLQYFRIKK